MKKDYLWQLKTFFTCLNSSEPCLFVLFEASSNVVTLDDCCSVPQFNLCCLKLEYSSLLISCSLELTFNVQSMIIYRMVIVEGRCDQLTSSSLHTYIIIGWHKSIVSSDWSDTMVWFGQILLLLYFYHPIYMILASNTRSSSRHQQASVNTANTIIIFTISSQTQTNQSQISRDIVLRASTNNLITSLQRQHGKHK